MRSLVKYSIPAQFITGKLSQASTQEPPTSNDEREMEGNFLSKGVYVDANDDVDGDYIRTWQKKKKKTTSSSERQRKETRDSMLHKLDASLSLYDHEESSSMCVVCLW